MAQCQTPFGVRDKVTGTTTPVPCGQCPNCLARRVSEWSFRLMQQEKVSSSAMFLTLTYDSNKYDDGTPHVPIADSGLMDLRKRDLQLFFKRLRKRHKETKLRYYACGEYGGQFWRPHYHVILFNALEKHVQPSWSLGKVFFGTCTGASIGYVLKYMAKPKRVPRFKGDVRVPEFSLMSKGMGANYLTSAMIAWHEADMLNRMYCTTDDNKKISMPRYYKQRLYSERDLEAIGDHLRQRNEAIEKRRMDEQGSKYYTNQIESYKAAVRKLTHAAANRDKF